MQDPIITFCIPSIGRVALSRTLNSLIAQENPRWRALVGFDCVENSIIDAMDLPKDSRIEEVRLKRKKGGGNNYGGGVRNALMKLATTPWIGFVDDDDSLRPHYVDALLHEEQNNLNAPCIVFRMSHDCHESVVMPPLNLCHPIENHVGISFAVKNDFVKKNCIEFENGGKEDFVFLKKVYDMDKAMVFSKHIVYNVRY